MKAKAAEAEKQLQEQQQRLDVELTALTDDLLNSIGGGDVVDSGMVPMCW